jgi:hypothetical protein
LHRKKPENRQTVRRSGYNAQWRMLREAVILFGDFTPNVVVTVTNSFDSAGVIAQSVPVQMNAGQSYSVSVTATNDGTTTYDMVGRFWVSFGGSGACRKFYLGSVGGCAFVRRAAEGDRSIYVDGRRSGQHRKPVVPVADHERIDLGGIS